MTETIFANEHQSELHSASGVVQLTCSNVDVGASIDRDSSCTASPASAVFLHLLPSFLTSCICPSAPQEVSDTPASTCSACPIRAVPA